MVTAYATTADGRALAAATIIIALWPFARPANFQAAAVSARARGSSGDGDDILPMADFFLPLALACAYKT